MKKECRKTKEQEDKVKKRGMKEEAQKGRKES